jgi:NAD(P)H-flavin reductase
MGTAVDPGAAARANPVVPQRFRVTAKGQETQDTWTLELEPLDGDAPFEFAPGQFNMVYAFGAGEVPISISGDAGRPATLVHTVRAVGAATRAICAAEPGDVLGVRGPYGSAWDAGSARGDDAVVVAGGIGLAPLRPVVYELLAGRDRFRRAIVLYGGRSPDQLLYAAEVEEWRAGSELEVRVTVDTATGDWRGRVGVVPGLIDGLGLEPGRTAAFVCGPEAMIDFSCRALLDEGVPAERIRVSMERNMKCAVGHCGHCQWGPTFVCRDGAVFSYAQVERLMGIREL